MAVEEAVGALRLIERRAAHLPLDVRGKLGTVMRKKRAPKLYLVEPVIGVNYFGRRTGA